MRCHFTAPRYQLAGRGLRNGMVTHQRLSKHQGIPVPARSAGRDHITGVRRSATVALKNGLRPLWGLLSEPRVTCCKKLTSRPSGHDPGEMAGRK
jgi:hypothetical protein